ncbi:MAG: 3-dehydroquinate dehydratase [Muribaculaceae bacterium]|nr:3-dehydroquinate dehydratase [Muribaculaceae bacterium]
MKNKYIAIINGPNLNRLGLRDAYHYDKAPFENTLQEIKDYLGEVCKIKYFQSNSEGAIIDIIQKSDSDNDCLGIVINPGAYAHYSYAIADAMADCYSPVIEVHISNIFEREDFRHTSVTAQGANALIAGCKRKGYLYGVMQILDLIEYEKQKESESFPF